MLLGEFSAAGASPAGSDCGEKGSSQGQEPLCPVQQGCSVLSAGRIALWANEPC